MNKITFPAQIVIKTERGTADTYYPLSWKEIKSIIESKKVKIEFIESYLNHEQKPVIVFKDNGDR